MHECGYERELKLQLLATQSWCARQRLDLVESAGELRQGLHEC